MDEEEEAEEALRIIEEVLADPSTNPRKRRATAVDSTIASTNRPGLGQSVSVEASAVGSFDGVAARDTVQEIDEFGSMALVDEGSEVRHVSKRAKARASSSSKGKEGAADPKSSKKRPAPGAGASTSKAAKKNKNSAAASQVRCEMNTDVKIAHEMPTHTARFAQSNMVTNDSNSRHCQGNEPPSTRGFTQTRVMGTGGRKSRCV